MVDDLTEIAVNAKDQTLDDTYIVFDIETTGFSSIRDRIIEIGAVKVENGQIVDKFSTFVNPERPIPFEITNLTSITDEMVLDAPTIEVVLPQFLEFIGEGALVAQDLMLGLSNRIVVCLVWNGSSHLLIQWLLHVCCFRPFRNIN